MKRPLRVPSVHSARKAATIKQRHHIARLAKRAGIETPAVVWRDDATDIINRLEHYLRQPQLDGMERVR